MKGQVTQAISGNRSAASEAWARHGADFDRAGGKFKTVSGIVETTPDPPDLKGVGNPDGALTTKRILANDVGDAVRRDAVQSGENAMKGARQIADQAEKAAEAGIDEVKGAGRAAVDKIRSWWK